MVVSAIELAFIAQQQDQRLAFVGAAVEHAGELAFRADFRELFEDFVVVKHHFLFEELGFDGHQAVETPAGGGHGLDQVGFGLAGRPEALRVGGAEMVEGSAVFMGEHNLAGIETVLDGVARRPGLAFRGDGTFRFRAVGTGGVGFGLRLHVAS
jgi:hypothetical protein